MQCIVGQSSDLCKKLVAALDAQVSERETDKLTEGGGERGRERECAKV